MLPPKEIYLSVKNSSFLLYTQFSLFTVIFYKGTVNTELANPEPLPSSVGNTELGSFKPLVTTFSSTNQYIPWCYVCFCLRHFIQYIVASLMLNMANHTVTHA